MSNCDSFFASGQSRLLPIVIWSNRFGHLGKDWKLFTGNKEQLHLINLGVDAFSYVSRAQLHMHTLNNQSLLCRSEASIPICLVLIVLFFSFFWKIWYFANEWIARPKFASICYGHDWRDFVENVGLDGTEERKENNMTKLKAFIRCQREDAYQIRLWMYWENKY